MASVNGSVENPPFHCKHRIVDSPADMIKSHLEFWYEIEAPFFVTNVFEKGYFLPFFNFPPPLFCKNNASALAHREFVEREIFELYLKNCIREVESSFICNPLSVSIQANGKKRLILDLRKVNDFLLRKKVKFEDLQTAKKFFSQNGWMFSFDMKSGYHHVPIALEHQKYLGFSWDFGQGSRFFVFCVLPFGLSVAPWLFSKLMRPLVKHWRGLGIPLVLYLDDALGVAPSLELANWASDKVQKDLVKAGILANNEKSVWVPTQKLNWLGFTIDLVEFKIEIPLNKREKAFLLARELNQVQISTARKLAQFAGYIMSFCLPLGSLVKLMTKNLYFLIETRVGWDLPLNLTGAAKFEIHFWMINIQRIPTNYSLPEQIILSDASSTGCGAILSSNNSKCYQNFSSTEIENSSTLRELKGVLFALESFKSQISNKSVLILTDNKACAKIIESGSMRPHLQQLALSIFAFAIENNSNLDARWIPRDLNTEADSLSKAFDSDDWAVRPVFFRHFNRTWGPYTVDRFADHKNAQVPTFNSRFHCPGSAGIDAFTSDWSKSANNWLVPPVHLVP